MTRAWPALPAIAVITVVLLRLGFDKGGYFPAAFTSAGAIAFTALAVLALRRARRLSMLAIVALGTLSAFACWMGLSRTWSVVPDVPLLDMQRGMLYVALLGLGLLATTSRRNARLLVWSVLALTAVFAGAALLSRVQPDLVRPTIDPFTALSYRLDFPFGYWNALGAVASLGAVLALGLAADAHGRTVLRAAAAGASVLLIVAMYLSLSRGAWLTLILGVVVLLAIAPNRGSLLPTLLIVGAAVTVAILQLRGYPALVLDPRAGAGQEAQGDAFSRVLLVLVGVVAATQAALVKVRAPALLRQQLSKVNRAALLIGSVAAVLAAGTAYAVTADGAKLSITSVADWFDQQRRDFLDPVTNPGVSTTRLLSAKGERSELYRVAIDGFEAHPIIGGGAGSFEVRYARDRQIDLKVRNAHSLPLETLSELGMVGMLLLLGFLGAVATAARRALSGNGMIRPAEAAAVTAAFTVWIAHASIDWNWQMPALTGTALVMCATLFPRGRRPRTTRRRGQRHERVRRAPDSVRRRAEPIPWRFVKYLEGRSSMRHHGWPKLMTMIVVAVFIGTAAGVGLAQLGRQGDPPIPIADASTTRAARSPALATGATGTPALSQVRARVLDAVLRPADTPSGKARGRARLTVRVRVENRGDQRVTFARPVLLAADAMITTDRNADTRDTNVESLGAGQVRAVTLRFEVAGAVTIQLRLQRRARLRFAERSLRLFVKVGAPVRGPSDTGTTGPTGPSRQPANTGTTAP